MDLGSYLLANPWTFARTAQPGPQHTGGLPVQVQLALVSFRKEIKRDPNKQGVRRYATFQEEFVPGKTFPAKEATCARTWKDRSYI